METLIHMNVKEKYVKDLSKLAIDSIKKKKVSPGLKALAKKESAIVKKLESDGKMKEINERAKLVAQMIPETKGNKAAQQCVAASSLIISKAKKVDAKTAINAIAKGSKAYRRGSGIEIVIGVIVAAIVTGIYVATNGLLFWYAGVLAAYLLLKGVVGALLPEVDYGNDEY